MRAEIWKWAVKEQWALVGERDRGTMEAQYHDSAAI